MFFFLPLPFFWETPWSGDKVESALARFSNLSDLPCSQRFIPKFVVASNCHDKPLTMTFLISAERLSAKIRNQSVHINRYISSCLL